MPRKTQFTAEDVVTAAFRLVKKKGLAGLSAPSVAAEMGCSTMPIYSHFENMQALEDEVVKKAWKILDDYQAGSYTGDVWVDQSVGYIRFARQEPHLFDCIVNSRNPALKYQLNRLRWENLGEALENYPGFKELDHERSAKIRYTRAMLSHGIASAAKIGLNEIIFENDDLLYRFMADASQALLEGYQKVPPLKGKMRQLLEERAKKLIDT